MAISTRINHLWRRYKWILPMSFLLSLLFFIAAVVMCRLRGFFDMDPRFAFSLGADMISLSVCAVLLYSLGQDKNSSSEYMRTFALLIFSVSAELFCNAAWIIADGIKELRIWNLIICVLSFAAATFLILFFWRYLAAALKLGGRLGRAANMIMNILFFPSLIMCLVNFFYPLYFGVGADGSYYRETLFPLSQMYFAAGMMIALIGFFVSKVPVKERLIAASFVLIPAANQFITLGSFELSTEYPAMLISIVLVFGVLVVNREKELIEKEKELYEAKVSVMVSQIQPHFMYNALTSIAMMCAIDPDTAQEATVTFAKYLRGNMDSLKQTAPVPFEQELEHLKKYLYIEKLRFGDMLNIEYDIQATDFKLPLLSIQPLVENAVKHGVGMAEDGGTVKISARETDNAFEVIISDDGVGFDTSAQKPRDGRSHVGMENTKRRIAEMCSGEIIIESAVGKGTVAKVILPKEGQHNEDTLS